MVHDKYFYFINLMFDVHTTILLLMLPRQLFFPTLMHNYDVEANCSMQQ